MKNDKSIKITKVRATDNKLEVELTVSKKISKYFLKNHFEIYYDDNIENVDESILAIPAVCATVQISWATGADLYVNKLDKTLILSLKNIRKLFEEFYPKFSSSGNIHVKKIISNKFNNKETALLFSGGLDSLVSYITHKDQNPILITLLKPGMSTFNYGYHNKVRKFHQKFADHEGLEIDYIESTIMDELSDTLNNRLLARDFGVHNWWGGVSHGLILLGFCAPLTVKTIGKIVMPATYPKNLRKPHGAHFMTRTDFSWGDVKVDLDATDLTRQGKIRHVFKANPQYHKYMRSCLLSTEGRPDLKECGECEKCLRTIAGLILEGIDPNECNFKIKDNVLDYYKNLLVTSSLSFQVIFYKEIQSQIPDKINNDEVSKRYHANQFFEWLREVDLENLKQGNSFFSKLKHLYFSLKYNGTDYPKQEIRMYFSRRLVNKFIFFPLDPKNW